ncbi:hypothetical protein [Streptomyces sp. NPDC058867]|uniref:hypothetical protein n=1 Tax=unclassified Streptomyces TaxID=2593676 RepID=UPI00368DC902
MPLTARRTGTLGLGLAATCAVAIGLDAVIAAAAHSAGASDEFEFLHLATYARSTVFGVLAGAAGWAVVRARAARPARALRILVPVGFLSSFLPNVALAVDSTPPPGTSWTAMSALMVMHVAVAAVAVPAYAWLMPVHDNTPHAPLPDRVAEVGP